MKSSIWSRRPRKHGLFRLDEVLPRGNRHPKTARSVRDHCKVAIVLRWLRRWRKRADQRLVKRPATSADIDPLRELVRIVNEAQERDAEDKRGIYHPMRGDRPSSYQRRFHSCGGRLLPNSAN
jgi:hypothetical protein